MDKHKLRYRLLGKAATLTYKGTKYVASAAYDHRYEAAGAVSGAVRQTAGIARDLTGITIREKDFTELLKRLEEQSRRYKQLVDRRLERIPQSERQELLDSLLMGGAYADAYGLGAAVIPDDVQQAYEMAYPNLAQHESLQDAIAHVDDDQLQGFVAGIKGKLFEIRYTDYLNDGHLPDGFTAQLADSPTNPGWDIGIYDSHGALSEELQLKATESANYVQEALEKYPHIDIVTTDEVYSQLAMQGFADHVSASGISDQDLTDYVHSSLESTLPEFDWMPSLLPFIIIAYTVGRKKDLSDYQKGKEFGNRSIKSYIAHLCGGAVLVATHTWWLGLIGAVGSRFLLGHLRNKRQRYEALKKMIKTNEQVLNRMAREG